MWGQILKTAFRPDRGADSYNGQKGKMEDMVTVKSENLNPGSFPVE